MSSTACEAGLAYVPQVVVIYTENNGPYLLLHTNCVTLSKSGMEVKNLIFWIGQNGL